MPRVNRDLQRRMAARRERERRRPSERRYRFATPEPAHDPDQALLEAASTDGEELEAEAVEAAPAQRPGGPSATATTRTPSIAASRGAPRAAAKPFSAYREEYAYVYRD